MSKQDLQGVQIDRVHRVGKFRQGQKRNIVAKVSSKTKTKIMTHLKNIPRGDDLRIQEQLPQEIQSRRNKLWPQFIQARKDGKQAKFSQDKLIIDNKVITAPKDCVRDINLDVTKVSLQMSPNTKHTGVVSHERDHFQGHTIPIKGPDDVIPALQSLCQDQCVAGSAHIMYAYRVGDDHYNISNFEDDGQYGGGREVMSAITNLQCYNHLVAVTRWHGGKHAGPVRYEHIKKVAEDAVKLVQK